MNENKESKIDYGIILSILLLAIISVATLFSTTYLIEGKGLQTTIMQIIWYIIGTIAIIVIMQFDSEQLWKLAPIAYGVGLLLLVLVLFFYDRPTEVFTGAKSWFKFGPLTFQPSEIMKIAFILMLARVVTQHNSEYDEHFVKADMLLIGKILLTSIFPLVLILLQNDLGTTLVFLAHVRSGIRCRWRIIVYCCLQPRYLDKIWI